ncbi:MAG: hypothetical protein ACYTAN_17360 [Planctomycetota bacterium]|jgi:hypothetical protein
MGDEDRSAAKACEKGRVRRRILRWAVATVILIAPATVFPRLWCGRGAAANFEGRFDACDPLAREVAAWVERGIGKEDFDTGSRLFDAEWLFGSHLMAGMGLLQVVEMHPETAPRYLPAVEKCIEELLSEEVRAFDTIAWSEDALETLDGPKGHAAYLGYMNLLLGYHRRLAGESQFAEINDAITAALKRRLATSPAGIIETYPGEAFPVDNAAVVGSLGAHSAATGADHGGVIGSWIDNCRERFVAEGSGLLYQAVRRRTGDPVDEPRASGTALAVYFLSFADKAFSEELFRALQRECATGSLGFGLVREYPADSKGGRGDIDSGPVVVGLSFSGTGFALSGCRIHGERDLYFAIYRTSNLIGTPVAWGNGKRFACGGPLGDAIMLAMLTAGGRI